MQKHKTYTYKLNPTPEQQERITALLDEKDRAFNILVDILNVSTWFFLCLKCLSWQSVGL